MTDEHLIGRLALLHFDLADIREAFPNGEHDAIVGDILEEQHLIQDELELRAKPKKSSKKSAKAIDNSVLADVDSYEMLLGIADEDDECEN